MKRLALVGMSLVVLTSATAQDLSKSDGLIKSEYIKYVASGKKTMIGIGYSLNPDCSSMGPVDVKITTPPQHGTVEVLQGQFYPNYSKEQDRYKCNSVQTTGPIVYYKSNDGFTGSDVLDAFVLLPGGFAQDVHYNVNVR